MSKLKEFAADRRGDMLKTVAVSAAFVGFGSLGLTQLLDHATRNGALPHISIVTSPAPEVERRMASLPRPSGPGGAGASGSYDATPIASIGGRAVPPVVLDPCTGQQH